MRNLQLASTPEEREEARAALEEVKAQRSERRPENLGRLSREEGEFAGIKARYATAPGQVAPYLREASQIQSDMSSSQAIYSAIQTISQQAWEVSLAALAALRRSPVGLASMSYNLYSDKVSSVQRSLADSKFTIHYSRLFGRGSF